MAMVPSAQKKCLNLSLVLDNTNGQGFVGGEHVDLHAHYMHKLHTDAARVAEIV